MRITSIELNTESSLMTIGGRKLQGVILTTKNWFGATKKIKAFPTNYGTTGRNGNNILYYHFADELGKELDSEISNSINNFLLNQELLGKF